MLRTCVARSLALGPALLAIPERTRLAPVGAEALHAQVVIATGGVILDTQSTSIKVKDTRL